MSSPLLMGFSITLQLILLSLSSLSYPTSNYHSHHLNTHSPVYGHHHQSSSSNPDSEQPPQNLFQISSDDGETPVHPSMISTSSHSILMEDVSPEDNRGGERVKTTDSAGVGSQESPASSLSPSSPSSSQPMMQEMMMMQQEPQEEPVTQLLHDEAGQCIFVKSEEGVYHYAAPGGTTSVCGLYLISEPDQFVEIEFESFQVNSCSAGGLVSVIDGWELNGQFFPGAADHQLPKSLRYHEFCNSKPVGSFVMSQNVGLVEFRLPIQGEAFKLRVKFRPNPKPCNAVLQKPQGVYSLRNYGLRMNCTASIIFPESFRILASNIGGGEGAHESSVSSSRNLVETGIVRQCRDSGLLDYVEIRGGDGLDPAAMATADDYCGVDSMPSSHQIDVLCGNTAVRLVSSGLYENSVTVAFSLIDDSKTPALVCTSPYGAL